MITTGEKIILGATALFLSGLCLFSFVPTVQTVIPESTIEEEAPASQSVTTTTQTTISTQASVSQEEITQETLLVNINTADLDELDTLPGIGEALGQRIIDYRTEHGDFASVEDITLVSGIGDVTLSKLQDYATVE